MTRPSAPPIILTQRDLEVTWRTMMGPDGFTSRSVWVMTIGPDDRPLPRIVEIAARAEPPDGQGVQNLAGLLRILAEDGGSRVGFLWSRSGSATVTGEDRNWAAALYAAAREAGLSCEVVHLATAGSVLPLPMDEVMPSLRDCEPAQPWTAGWSHGSRAVQATGREPLPPAGSTTPCRSRQS